MTGCDHKFIDSQHCLKCGWKPDEYAIPADVGMTLDMIDADRMAQWASNIQQHGGDITSWSSPHAVAQTLGQLARDIRQAVIDIGVLRKGLLKIEQLQKDLDTAKRAKFPTEYAEKWAPLREKQMEVERLTADLGEARTDNKTLIQEVEAREVALTAQQTEADNLQRDNTRLLHEATGLRRDNSLLIQEVAALRRERQSLR